MIKARGLYLHFQVDDQFAFDLPPDCQDQYWVEISIRDTRSTALDVEYDAHQVGASERSQWTASLKQQLSASGEWKSLYFELPQARFANRQNGGADFRLRTVEEMALEIGNVTLYRQPTAEVPEAKAVP